MEKNKTLLLVHGEDAGASLLLEDLSRFISNSQCQDGSNEVGDIRNMYKCDDYSNAKKCQEIYQREIVDVAEIECKSVPKPQTLKLGNTAIYKGHITQ